MSLQKSNAGQRKSPQSFSPANHTKVNTIPFTSSSDYDALAEHKLFRDIPRQFLESLLAECQMQEIQKDEVLISPGEENHHLYLLLSGRLQVCLDTADSNLSFSIEPGECIGEMSVIEERLTSAYVSAEEASRMLVLPKEIFWEKFVCLPEAVRNLLQVLSRRMRRHNQVTLQTLEQQLRYEHLQKELEAAGKIQANILPKKEPLFPRHPQVDVFAMMEAAKVVGGDFFDAFALDNRHIYIAIGDVSGKGMPAALFMVRVMTLLRMSVVNEAAFGSVLPTVNRMLCENNDDCMFVTLFVGVLDVFSGKLTYMNGGHNPPFLAREGHDFEPLAVPKGLLLGVNEAAPYTVAELTLGYNDTLVLYTDGVTEAENAQKEFFSGQRTADILNARVQPDMKSLVNTLHTAILDFAAGVPQADDITMLALRYRGDSQNLWPAPPFISH